MDIEKLINEISKEVIKRLKELNIEKKEKFLVLANGFDELNKLNELLGYKYDLILYDEKITYTEEFKGVILNELSNSMLSFLALGLCIGPKEKLVVDFLLNGKNVYVLQEGIEYRKYQNEPQSQLIERYKSYENMLISYGVTILNINELLKSLSLGEKLSILDNCSDNVPKDINQKLREKKIVINKKLITESDLKKVFMYGVKEISISRKAILTPLANDFIKIHRLKVNKSELEEAL